MQNKQTEKPVSYAEPSTDYAQTTSKGVLKTVVAVVGLGGILLGNVASAKGVDGIDKFVAGTDSNNPSNNPIVQKVTDDIKYTNCYPTDCIPCPPPCIPECYPEIMNCFPNNGPCWPYCSPP